MLGTLKVFHLAYHISKYHTVLSYERLQNSHAFNIIIDYILDVYKHKLL